MRAPLLALGIALALPACDSLDTFEVPVEGTAQIPGSPLGSVPIDNLPLEIPGLNNFSFEKSFKDNGISADDVESVKLTSLVFGVTEPEGGTIDFLQKIEVFAEADGVEKRKIAEKSSIPDGATSVSLDVMDVEFKPYAVAKNLAITTIVSGRPPTHDTAVRARAVFEVNAAVF
ncbi:hypothetical protein [Vulgatibacter sp.]|uniref:hypothetical protein n=1 Tax=Vulgatibacter sp. TaxID=1971226 RepID=UPI0035679A10